MWIDGKARVLIDLGGGSFLRFGEARANLEDVSVIAVTHLHPDHVSDLPAFLWAPTWGGPVVLSGPGVAGSEAAPGFQKFLDLLLDQKNGAFPLVGGRIGGTVQLRVSAIDQTKLEPSIVFSGPDVTVSAVGVLHGRIPTVAYRVHAKNRTVVFSGDQNGSDSRFTARPAERTSWSRTSMGATNLP